MQTINWRLRFGLFDYSVPSSSLHPFLCLSSDPASMTPRRSLLLVVACLALVSVCMSVSASQSSYRDKIAKYNARVGQKFLDEKASEEGVTKLSSGVLYKVLTEGSGDKHPDPTSQVKVHYRGTLIKGEEFDSSYSRGQPATFGVNGVIKGWTEVLQLMVPGDIWEVYIPADKAYGANGSGKKIGPNSTLVFKIELLEVLTGGKKAERSKKEDL